MERRTRLSRRIRSQHRQTLRAGLHGPRPNSAPVALVHSHTGMTLNDATASLRDLAPNYTEMTWWLQSPGTKGRPQTALVRASTAH